MRFVDAARREGPASVHGEWTAPRSGPWIRGASLRRVAVLEFAAQTAAAHAGIERLERGLPPLSGFLGGVEGFVFEDEASAGERLRCRVEVRFRLGGTVRVSCDVRGGDGRPVARGELSLVVPPAREPGRG